MALGYHEIDKFRRFCLKRLRTTALYLLNPFATLIIVILSEFERIIFNRGLGRYSISGRIPGQKRDIQDVVCVVVGQGHQIGLLDIIESARCYLDGSYRIIVVDNSSGMDVWRVVRRFPEVDYLRNRISNGLRGLDSNLQRAYRYAIRQYNFDVLLKMDTDALMTGPGLTVDAVSYFAANPKVGMLGSYRASCAGTTRDFSDCEMLFIRNWDHWKALIEKAQGHGYEIGENVQGGAYLLSAKCLKEMEKAGYLFSRYGGTYIPEDFLFSLRVRAVGYEICDFAYKGPMAIAWHGLPIPKEEVTRQNKKVVHSIKFTPEDLMIRDYFKKKREEFANAQDDECVNEINTQAALPFVSVIVPVYNDSARISKCIEALMNQTYPKDRYEIVVIDNGSTDNTRAMIERYPVRLLVKDVVQSSYAARNKGIRNSRGEVIAFTDSDCIPDKNWLELGVINLLKVPNCGLVAGRINIFYETPDKPNAVELYDSITNFKQKDDIRLRNFGSTANVITYRKVLDQVGLFKESLKSGGDNEWGRRVFAAGYKQVYADDACVAHPARKTFTQLYNRYTRLVGGCYDQYMQKSYKAYVRELIKNAVAVIMLPSRVLSGNYRHERLKGFKRKMQFISVFTLVQMISVFERTRLLMGGESRR